MNFDRLYRDYEFGEEVYFTENEELAQKRMKENIPYFLAINIYVMQDDEIISKYQREFDKEISFTYYQRFIKKFLREPSYREQYLNEGEINWDGRIVLRSPNGITEAERIS